MTAILIRNSLRGLQHFLVIAIALFPAPFFGGVGITPNFTVRVALILCFFAFGSRLIFFPEERRSFRGNGRSVLLFASSLLGFAVLLGVQWAMGHAVLSKAPGSLVKHATMQYGLQLAAYASFFFVTYDFLSTKRRARFLILLLAAEVTFLVALGFYQSHSEVNRLNVLYGIFDMSGYVYYSSFLNTNHYGAFLALATPLLIASVFYYLMSAREEFTVDARTVETTFYAMLVPMMTLSIYDAEARAALAWQAALVAVFVLWFFLRRPFVIVSIFLAGAVAIWKLMSTSKVYYWQKLMEDFDARMGIYKDASQIFHDFPLFGVGAGAIRYVFPYYQRHQPENLAMTHIVNQHLELLVETGVLGYTLLILPLAGFATLWVLRTRRRRSRWVRYFGFAAFVAVCSAGALSLVDEFLLEPAVALWLTFYLALLARCGISHTDEQEEGTEEDPPTPPHAALWARTMMWAAFSVLCAWFLAGAWEDYKSEKTLSDPESTTEQLLKAAAGKPLDPGAWLVLGARHYEDAVVAAGKNSGDEFRRLVKQSVDAYRRITQLAPTWSDGWVGLGKAEVLAGERLRGLEHMAKGVKLSPFNRDIHVYLLLAYLKMARNTPWKSEQSYFLDKALFWAEKTCLFPTRPLTAVDYRWILNNTVHTPEDERLLKAIIKRVYENHEKRLLSIA